MWLEPSVPAQIAGSAGAPKAAHSQRNPESPATSSAREWNVLLGCCWQEVGSLGASEGGGSCHKATSVLLGTEVCGGVLGGQTVPVSSGASSSESGDQNVRELPRM